MYVRAGSGSPNNDWLHAFVVLRNPRFLAYDIYIYIYIYMYVFVCVCVCVFLCVYVAKT
jgi:hypothetical protein